MTHSTPPLPADWITVREWDEARGHPKGTAFRRFKHCVPGWVEGQHYRRLDHSADAPTLQHLKLGNRLYMSTVHAVLLSPSAARSMDDPAS
jgi:hypothetical protein